MKNTCHARPLARIAATTAATALATTGLAIPAANALLSDNVHNIAGGGANIHADNTCVEKVGDTAHVKFMAQHQPLVMSSDHAQTSASGTLAIPANMKNVEIRIKAAGYAKNGSSDVVSADVFDDPIEVPVEEGNGEGHVGPTLFKPVFGNDGKEYLGGKESIEKNIADGAKLVRHPQADLKDEEEETVNNGSFPFSSYGTSDVPWYGHHDTEYVFYEFGSLFTPLTFEVEGDIATTGEDTFATAAISNIGWKSGSENGAGSYEQGSQALVEYPQFRPGGLPPAVPEDEDMIQAYKDKLSDAGLDISPYIAPTSEIPGNKKYSYIGSDIRPSARGDAGEVYAKIFTLRANRAVTYIGQVPQSAEDGADVTAAHVTLCPSDETPPETDVPETETPETEVPETETPETETPETETPETETPETETPETETPETETPETDTPETETPETDVPETETPETDTPETETPNTGTSETDTPAPAPSNDGNTGSRTLASTGASVIGIGVAALVLLGAGFFLARRKKD